MWSYIAGGLKIKVIKYRKLPFGTKSSGLISKGSLKIEGCKIEGLLYNNDYDHLEMLLPSIELMYMNK